MEPSSKRPHDAMRDPEFTPKPELARPARCIFMGCRWLKWLEIPSTISSPSSAC
ncbi:hypothetical protein K438DRAFT_1810095, partial [Mycena galopus ATCC 62051]